MPLPLLLIPLWEVLVAILSWVAANKVRALTIAALTSPMADALTDNELSELMRRLRNGFAATINSLIDTSLNGDDFESAQRFKIGLGREIGARAGIVLRDVTDRETLREDLESHALLLFEQKTGMRLTSLRDKEAIKQDFARLAASYVAENAGIPLSNILDPEAVKADVMEWAQDQAMIRISENVDAALQARLSSGVSLLQQMRDSTGKNVSPKALLVGINDAIVSRYIVRVDVLDAMSKPDRRRMSNRIAQRKFRDRANPSSPLYDGRTGGKAVYVAKGWQVQQTPPAEPPG
ncbi:hypothetical protein [Dechloromonas sp. A34]|uniref:hypothetical protein n=1 Tax=Dechloromonas sp. A34 TaxID=447588 RepID=UPI0022490A0E|nr:hypothetical protein [Dechloromonas sp. A34]